MVSNLGVDVLEDLFVCSLLLLHSGYVWCGVVCVVKVGWYFFVGLSV